MRAKPHPWALGIAGVVVLFPLGILALAVLAGRSDPNMVTDRYYEKDRNYERRIEVARRSAALPETPRVRYDAASGVCTLRFPASIARAVSGGSVHFYRASDRRMDFSRALALDSSGAQRFEAGGLQRGAWRVKLTWTAGGLEYAGEDRFTVP